MILSTLKSAMGFACVVMHKRLTRNSQDLELLLLLAELTLVISHEKHCARGN